MHPDQYLCKRCGRRWEGEDPFSGWRPTPENLAELPYAVRAYIDSIKADNERLDRLNTDKFNTIQAYCKEASRDKAKVQGLRAVLHAATKAIDEAVPLLDDYRATIESLNGEAVADTRTSAAFAAIREFLAVAKPAARREGGE
jgi:hypothetical protein